MSDVLRGRRLRALVVVHQLTLNLVSMAFNIVNRKVHYWVSFSPPPPAGHDWERITPPSEEALGLGATGRAARDGHGSGD
jgi:hypothetical protein